MRSVARWLVLAGMIAWQSAACWAIGPMGFSDPQPPPPPVDGARGPATQFPAEADSQSIPESDMSGHDPYAAGGCGCQACCRNCLASKLLIGVFCNMPQHYAYPSPWDRYYYFRPYNYFQVNELQKTVAGWGQDPRNISDNRFFQAIYDRVDPSGKQGPYKPATAPEPVPAPAPSPPAKPIEQGRTGPIHRAPRAKVTWQELPGEPVPRTAPLATKSAGITVDSPAGARAPHSDAGNDSQVELIRFVVP